MQKRKTKTEKGLFPPTIPGLSAIKQVNPLKTNHPSKKTNSVTHVCPRYKVPSFLFELLFQFLAC